MQMDVRHDGERVDRSRSAITGDHRGPQDALPRVHAQKDHDIGFGLARVDEA